MSSKRKPPITYSRKRRRSPFTSFTEYNNDADTDMGSWLPPTNQINYSQQPPPLPPNKPTSQKAATMAVEPNEDQISMLIDFTGMPKSEAVRYLKVCNA